MTGSGRDISTSDEDRRGLWLSSDLSRRQFLIATGTTAMLAGLAACGGDTSTSSQGPTGSPTPGGDFRLGVTGGGAKDIMDGQNIVTKPDQARLVSAFETLLTFDREYHLTSDGLAESVEADNPTQYTIRLRKGIEFQDGK